MQQRSIEQIALQQFATLEIPVLIGVARWGCYIDDFRDDRLMRAAGDTSSLSRTVICMVSPVWLRGPSVRMNHSGFAGWW